MHAPGRAALPHPSRWALASPPPPPSDSPGALLPSSGLSSGLWAGRGKWSPNSEDHIHFPGLGCFWVCPILGVSISSGARAALLVPPAQHLKQSSYYITCG